jgi:membrane dipeptidase
VLRKLKASQVAATIPIIDAHLDLAWNALSWNRDLTLDLADLNAIESPMTDHRARGHATVSLPEMHRAGITICLGTLLARAKPQVRPPEGYRRRDLDYANQTIASAAARGQLAYYQLLQRQKFLRILTTRAALNDHWNQPDRLGLIIAMEGGDPITSPTELQDWYDAGLRVIGLAHYGPSAYAVGTGATGPLTSAGIALLKEMSRLNLILDLTHCCDESFHQALDHFDGPVLASHNNCRAIIPGDRQFSDDQIKKLIAREAVIGCALDVWMLKPNWKIGVTTPANLTLSALVDHIDHICQLAGNTRHVAIGSDLDGGFGTEQTPQDLTTIADLQNLAPLLLSRGYSETDVNAIFHNNWLRFFTHLLPE